MPSGLDFKVGDMVVHSLGGAVMRVDAIEGNMVMCRWRCYHPTTPDRRDAGNSCVFDASLLKVVVKT